MNIIEQINADPDLLALANTEKWQELAAAWPVTRLPDYRATGRETLVALMAAGIDANAVLQAVEASAVGRRLLGLLDSDGVNWADEVTIGLLDQLVAAGGITQTTADVLIAASYRADPKPTADEVKAAWQEHLVTEERDNLIRQLDDASMEASRPFRVAQSNVQEALAQNVNATVDEKIAAMREAAEVGQ